MTFHAVAENLKPLVQYVVWNGKDAYEATALDPILYGLKPGIAQAFNIRNTVDNFMEGEWLYLRSSYSKQRILTAFWSSARKSDIHPEFLLELFLMGYV